MARERVLVRAMRESELQRLVVELALLCGWLVSHTRPARTLQGWRTPVQGSAGFPDLVLVRGGSRPRLVFAELKSARGQVGPEQEAWLSQLRQAGAEVYVWRPADWPAIEALLRGLA